MENLNRFYTYAYLREDRTPYYIGKGEGRRIYKKGKGEVKLPKDKSRIIFLKQNLTEKEAFRHEIYMIDVFGRKDLGTGILRNRTNGGDGPSGRTPWNKGKLHTEETKRKQSEMKKGLFSITKDDRSKRTTQTNYQKWMCLETGFITNAGNLSQYQKARGIDKSKRVRIS